MTTKLKLDKFGGDGAGFWEIRSEILPSGKIIAFGIAGTDLAVLGFGHDIDFDKESDELIDPDLFFRYIPSMYERESNFHDL
ncbi:MAG: hypothetical protein KGL39_02305 [Patescibacteria group bacterium]|nr:hypothetical protein [Patescibacteria group bacterium]